MRRWKVLVLDDDTHVLKTVKMVLGEAGYTVELYASGAEALKALPQSRPDVILSDIRMPRMDGIEFMEKAHEILRDVPVVLMTAYAEFDTTVNAIKKGVFDFTLKPFSETHLLHAIGKAVSHVRSLELEKNYLAMLEQTVDKRTAELSDALAMVKTMSYELVKRLTMIAEYRDEDTRAHILRMGYYADLFARRLGMAEDFVEKIMFAAPLHDIGKIGIPDSILLKPAALTAEEFRTMQAHTVIGYRMLADSTHPSLQMAGSIALTHHERWDGSGYPKQLKGEAIPLEGRIMIVIDHYDAMRSRRPYKSPLSHEEAVLAITTGDEKAGPRFYDPMVLAAFVTGAGEFEDVFEEHKLFGTEC